METASEDELRSVEDEMRAELDSLDSDSDEYLQLDLKRIDVVNAIASRFDKTSMATLNRFLFTVTPIST